MKVYKWNPETKTVTVVVSGHPRQMEHIIMRANVLDCGNDSKGSLDLALSIIYDLEGPAMALRCYRAFAKEVVAKLTPESHWRLTDEQIKYRLASIRERARNREASACERKVGVA